ncbi:MAG: hypothetical protein ACXW37_11475 [Nitrospira sp.]
MTRPCPHTYRQYCHLLAQDQACVVTGVVEEHFSTVTVRTYAS